MEREVDDAAQRALEPAAADPRIERDRLAQAAAPADDRHGGFDFDGEHQPYSSNATT